MVPPVASPGGFYGGPQGAPAPPMMPQQPMMSSPMAMQPPVAAPAPAAPSSGELEDPFASISLSDNQSGGPGGSGGGSKFAVGEDVMYTDGSGNVFGAEVRCDRITTLLIRTCCPAFLCLGVLFKG